MAAGPQHALNAGRVRWVARARRVAPFHLYRTGAFVARGLPGRVGEAAASAAGVVAGRLSTDRRAMITRHLARIEGHPVDRREVDRAFASYGRYWLEAFRLPSVDTADLEAAMCYEGIGNVEEALARGHGVLLAMPHVGAWDWGGAWMSASGFPMTVVAEALQPVELAEWFAAWRQRVGMTVITLDHRAGSGVMSALARRRRRRPPLRPGPDRRWGRGDVLR